MYSMFGDTENFRRDLSKWKLNSNVKIDNMFNRAPKVDVETITKARGVSANKLGKNLNNTYVSTKLCACLCLFLSK